VILLPLSKYLHYGWSVRLLLSVRFVCCEVFIEYVAGEDNQKAFGNLCLVSLEFFAFPSFLCFLLGLPPPMLSLALWSECQHKNAIMFNNDYWDMDCLVFATVKLLFQPKIDTIMTVCYCYRKGGLRKMWSEGSRICEKNSGRIQQCSESDSKVYLR
jgi:hypothetical protein